MKLLSMTEFVLQENFKTHSRFFPETTIKYAEFLKQPLTLGMFVPVDEEGNVLEEPTQEKYGWYSSCSQEEQYGWMYEEGESKYHDALEKWNKAKEKVLFEGFKIEDIGLGSFAIKKRGWIIMKCSKAIGAKWENVASYQTIEDLVNLDIELTPSALKQIPIP